jgi:hypothetical protein
MCCGKKRATLTAPVTGTAQRSSEQAAAYSSFRYIGNTALTTVGVHTGSIYRFAAKGAVLQVHPKDAESMRYIPNLEECKM